jgi:tRNA(Ile)-lysidine synthase
MHGDRNVLELVRLALYEMNVPPGAHILVGISGGLDSSCLADILHRLSADLRFDLTLAHFDHGLRPESETIVERERVEAFASERSLGLVTGYAQRGRIEGEARRDAASLEAVARNYRLSFLRETLGEKSADFIALGHHGDDQTETVLMRMLTGAGPEGIAGIRARRDRIIRPLLGLSKVELRDYARDKRLVHTEDGSNADRRFLRNRLRTDVLPVLGDALPGFKQGLETARKRSHLVADFMRSESERMLPAREEGRERSLSSSAFFATAPALRLQRLYDLIDEVLPVTTRIPFRFLEPLLSDRGRIGSRSPRILLGHGVEIREQGDRLIIGPHSSSEELFFAHRIDLTDNDAFGLPSPLNGSVLVLRGRAEEAELSDCVLPLGTLGNSPVLRTRRAGDVLRSRGGNRSLKKLYSECERDSELRSCIPLVEDRGGVLAVWGAPWGADNVYDLRCEGVQTADGPALMLRRIL